MEEYLQNMKSLRFQMNDVEDQAAKNSVEEQTQITSIHAMEIDLESAKSKIKSLKEETELMLKEKGEICLQILDKHKKIASLEAESSTLSQTLELIQQERLSLSSKFQLKRSYYTKVMEELSVKLQAQQDWINSHNLKTEVGQLQADTERNRHCNTLVAKLDSARAKLDEITRSNSNIISDCSKIEQSVKQIQSEISDFPPELRAMTMNSLEEEHKALLSDKAGEMEYLQSLHCQIEKLKGISHVITCACGEEYNVEMVTCS